MEGKPLLSDARRNIQEDVSTVSVRSRKWSCKDVSVSVCLWLAYLICSAAYSIIAPFFPKEAEAKGFTPIITGVIISSSPFFVVILSPVFGYFLPHFGVKYLISAGLLLIGGSFVLLGFVDLLPSNWVFALFGVLLRSTEGIGSAMFITATFTVLPVLFPKSVGTVMGVFEVAGGLGFALGPPLGGLLYQYGGFKLPFLVVGISVLLFIFPCTFMVKEISSKTQTPPMFVLTLRILSNFPFFLLVLVNIVAIGSLAFFTPTLQPFLSDQFKFNELKVGLVFLIGPMMYMIAAFFVGPLSDKLGHRWFIVFGLVFYGLGFFFMGPADFIAAPKVWLTCLCFAVVGIAAAFAAIPPYADMLTIAKRLVNDDENRDIQTALTAIVSGVVSSSFSLGEFLGPLVGGALTNVLPFTTSAFLVGEVLLAMGLLLLGVTLIEKHTRHW